MVSLHFKEVIAEDLLLSALKKDIEDNVMERVIKYFSKYDEQFRNINVNIADHNTILKNLDKNNNALQKRYNNFQRRMNELEKGNGTNTSVQILQEHISKLEEITKVFALRSCHEYKSFGMRTSGSYYIDPDGREGAGSPFLVRCDLKSGTTEIMHDHKEKIIIPHCSGDMCYHVSVQYPTSTMDQLKTLIDLSDVCTQEIQFECYLAPLYTNTKSVGSWLNRDGKEESYFSGSHHGHHICSCGLNRTCSSHRSVCNCDTGKPELQTDFGIITNMSALPITGFKYGQFQFEGQSAAITIGQLKCSGEKTIPLSRIYSSCQSLKRYGNMVTGKYIINNGSLVFCDMERNIWDPQLQIHIGHLQFKDMM